MRQTLMQTLSYIDGFDCEESAIGSVFIVTG